MDLKRTDINLDTSTDGNNRSFKRPRYYTNIVLVVTVIHSLYLQVSWKFWG